MEQSIQPLLKSPQERLDEINAVLLDPNTRVIRDLLDVVARHGTPAEINRKAAQAGELSSLLQRVRETKPEFLDSLRWLETQRDRGAFISVADYRRKVLGDRAASMHFKDDFAVTIEVSAAKYFPWVIAAAERAIEAALITSTTGHRRTFARCAELPRSSTPVTPS
jgi:hypothetical protein